MGKDGRPLPVEEVMQTKLMEILQVCGDTPSAHITNNFLKNNIRVGNVFLTSGSCFRSTGTWVGGSTRSFWKRERE